MARILIVEDNDMNRDVLARYLQSEQFQVLIALDGVEGVARAQAERPDLILMDLSLPTMDGLDAARRIKADHASRDIPIIALTAHALAGDRERAIAAGCDDYEPKPIDFQRLLLKIRSYLTRSAGC